MTDLLQRSTDHDAPDAAESGDHGPGVGGTASLLALLEGAVAALSVLVGLGVLALAGWYAADAGLRWEPHAALRVAGDAWALAHGSGLALPGGSVGALPLGITLLALLAARRAGRRVGERSGELDDAELGMAAGLLLGGYLLVTLVTVVLASTDRAGPGLGRALLGGTLVVAVGALPPLARTTGRRDAWADRLPAAVPGVLRAARATALLVLAAGAAALGLALALHLQDGADVLSRLRTSPLDALLVLAACLAALPNAALLTVSYLAGSGVVLGSGTLVAPTVVVLGPLPAFPLLVVLPGVGTQPAWLAAIQVLPVLVGVVVALLLRHGRPASWTAVLAESAGGAALGGLGVAVLVLLAGGAVGPGRMADVGAPALSLLMTLTSATALGGLLGGLLVLGLGRRAARATDGAAAR